MSPAGAVPVSNPFAAAGDRSPAQRFATLKLRTALVCVAMLLCAVGGWQLLQGPLSALVTDLWQTMLGQRGLPAPHVPAADVIESAGLRALMQRCLLGGVLAVALICHSYGKLGGLSIRWALLPPVLIALVSAWLSPATHGWLPLLPGPLERDILYGRMASIETRLEDAEASKALRHYLLAQAALRTRESALLQREGELVLQQADRVAYGLAVADELALGLQFDPSIVLALDLALHQEPQTEVGLGRQARGQPSELRSGAASTARVVAGAALLAAAWALLRMWNLMRRRVATIADQLAVDAARDGTHERGRLLKPKDIGKLPDESDPPV